MKRKASKIFIGVMCYIVFTIVCFFCTVLVFRCGIFKDLEVKTDGFFKYVIVGENSRVPNLRNKAVVAIVGFTWSGEQQEIIDIPREIDGKPVRRIGYDDQFRHDVYTVYSQNLKKIYIHDNIRYINNFEGGKVDVMLCSANNDFSIYDSDIMNIYFYKSMTDREFITMTVSYANIVYMNNYTPEINEGYYRLDNIEMGEKVPEPPSPERGGYEFTGWFTEPECINAWNFDVSPNIEENTEFRLYAGWRAV